MNDRLRQAAGFVVFGLAIVFLAFVAGMLAGVFKIPPYPSVEGSIIEAARALKSDADKGQLHFMYL